ncbi:YtcA family lipoprotein [Bordetella sp. 02P26C-1]|uniref:YtcA family lipoprotein n=1 Tax=Bordetella sp. 02P26C-1 TaxID=2683195 RepID=UPI0013534462|nr:YtcA family lipoprotein [Bordetella sp. 02P26C-1]MVW77710.1 hypothetical protein [Bordetella sp. 02P26C-1]
MNHRHRQAVRMGTAFAAMLLLAGCSAALPPYVVVFESYFPSWLICAALGCVAALIARVVLVRLGLDEFLPLPFVTYLAIAAIVMFLLSLLLFAR